MKNVLIRAFEGNVYIKNVPTNISPIRLCFLALDVLNKKNGDSLPSISNVEYVANPIFLSVEDEMEYVAKNKSFKKDKIVRSNEIVYYTVEYKDVVK